MTFTIFRKICWSVILLTPLIFNASCNTQSKYLVNDWKVRKFQPGVDFSASPEHMKVFQEFEKYARFQFNKDGTYSFDLVGEKLKGKWKFDRKTMTLTTTSENNVVTTSKILELTAEKMVLEQESEGYKNRIELVPNQ